MSNKPVSKSSVEVLAECYSHLRSNPNVWFEVDTLAKELKLERELVVSSLNKALKDVDNYPRLKKSSKSKNTFYRGQEPVKTGYRKTTIKYRYVSDTPINDGMVKYQYLCE